MDGNSTAWKFGNIPGTLISRKNNFGCFQKVLTILEALNFDFWKNFTLGNVKNLKFRAAQMVKMAVFGASK